MEQIRFLEIEEVIGIHRIQIERFGGLPGIRDLGLLESAVVVPQSSFAGFYAHTSLADIAAAYIFHIIKNHPFYDGNKRTGVLSGLVFLRSNGCVVSWSQDQLVELGERVASSELTKEEIAALPFLTEDIS